MKKIMFAVVGMMLGFAVSTDAEAQDFFFDEEPMEEIVVTAPRQDRPDYAGFNSIFELMDFRESYENLFNQQLRDLLDQANEASEQLCRQQIDSWVADCHQQVNVLVAGCTLSGGLLVGAAARAFEAFARLIGVGGGSATAFSCSNIYQDGHASCDAIGASSEGPRVAGCAGAG